MPGESIWQRPDLAAADAYREQIGRCVDEMAELEAQSVGWIEPAHRRTLAEFSEWMRVRPFDDPILWMLHEVESALGKEDAAGERVKGFAPGVEQRSVLQNAGCGLTAVEPQEVAANLVIAGLRDVQNKMRKGNKRLQQGQEDARRLEVLAAERDRARGDAADARTETEEAKQEVRNLKEQLQFLRDRLPTEGRPEPEATPKNGRRLKVEGAPGVYRTGDEFEINFRDSEGKSKWEKVGSLEEAKRIRAERVERVTV